MDLHLSTTSPRRGFTRPSSTRCTRASTAAFAAWPTPCCAWPGSASTSSWVAGGGTGAGAGGELPAPRFADGGGLGGVRAKSVAEPRATGLDRRRTGQLHPHASPLPAVFPCRAMMCSHAAPCLSEVRLLRFLLRAMIKLIHPVTATQVWATSNCGCSNLEPWLKPRGKPA